jgi:hypothetical protein
MSDMTNDGICAFKPGDYIHLEVRGDFWRVKKIDFFQGIDSEHMLTLEWICGDDDPGRICKFSSGQAIKVNEMEIIALMAS